MKIHDTAMKKSLNELGENLIEHIKVATSQKEVAQIIHNALKPVIQDDTIDNIDYPFIENFSNKLHTFSAYTTDSMQWSNIKMARIILNRIKTQWHPLVV